MEEPRREIPEPTYHWPSGTRADDDPTPPEAALGALKAGAILAAAVTIAFIYAATYSGAHVPRSIASVSVLAAFCLPSVAAWLRARRSRSRRRPSTP